MRNMTIADIALLRHRLHETEEAVRELFEGLQLTYHLRLAGIPRRQLLGADFRLPQALDELGAHYGHLIEDRRTEGVRIMAQLLLDSTKFHIGLSLPGRLRGGREFHLLPVSDQQTVRVTHYTGQRLEFMACELKRRPYVRITSMGRNGRSREPRYVPVNADPQPLPLGTIAACDSLAQAEDWINHRHRPRDGAVHRFTLETARRYLPSLSD